MDRGIARGGEGGGGRGTSGIGGGGGGGGTEGTGIMSRDAASNRYEIPSQLQQLVLDFTVICLVERPADLVGFAADYFAQLRSRQQQQQQHQGRDGSVARSATHGNGHGPESDDSMLTDESDEPSPGKIFVQLSIKILARLLPFFFVGDNELSPLIAFALVLDCAKTVSQSSFSNWCIIHLIKSFTRGGPTFMRRLWQVH